MSVFLWLLSAFIIGGIAYILVLGAINRNKIKERVKAKGGLYAKLSSISGDAVNYKIYTLNNSVLCEEKMTSVDDYVDSSLKKDQCIFI